MPPGAAGRCTGIRAAAPGRGPCGNAGAEEGDLLVCRLSLAGPLVKQETVTAALSVKRQAVDHGVRKPRLRAQQRSADDRAAALNRCRYPPGVRQVEYHPSCWCSRRSSAGAVKRESGWPTLLERRNLSCPRNGKRTRVSAFRSCRFHWRRWPLGRAHGSSPPARIPANRALRFGSFRRAA